MEMNYPASCRDTPASIVCWIQAYRGRLAN